MNRNLLTIILLTIIGSLHARGEKSIEDCVRLAGENYPLISKYAFLTQTENIELSDINKLWLPKIGIYGQVTGQNVVPSFPQQLTQILQQMGQEMAGLNKVQYKVGVDLSQTIWDGGSTAVRRDVAVAKKDVAQASLDVEMYAIKERVENLYFAILLSEEQITINNESLSVLAANLEKIQSMVRNGTAIKSDADMIEAQMLSLKQTITLAESSVHGYRTLMGIFTGTDFETETLIRPRRDIPETTNSDRPELRLFDTKIRLNNLSNNLANTSLMPKIGFFAQAYYGYPGFDYFKSMMSRKLSFNVMAGVKVSWNIDSFYTKKNSETKTAIENESILTEREIFLFNTSMQTASQRTAITGLQNVIADDKRIIELRTDVRHAAESQLANGVIDATALLAKITDENISRLSAQLHEIQLIQEIYKLKNTLNK